MRRPAPYNTSKSAWSRAHSVAPPRHRRRREQMGGLVLTQKGGQVGPAFWPRSPPPDCRKAACGAPAAGRTSSSRTACGHGGGLVAAVKAGQIRATDRRGKIRRVSACAAFSPASCGRGRTAPQDRSGRPAGVGRGALLAGQVLAKSSSSGSIPKDASAVSMGARITGRCGRGYGQGTW